MAGINLVASLGRPLARPNPILDSGQCLRKFCDRFDQFVRAGGIQCNTRSGQG
jgi:hypothetical protein